MNLDKIVEETNTFSPQVLPIIQYPHPALSAISKPVIDDIVTNKSLQELLENMVITMQKMGGVGLAAIQVGYELRCLVLQDLSGKTYKVINPSLKEVSSEVVAAREGCLSFVGLTLNVRRPASCKVEYFDETGTLRVLDGNALIGRAIQHEMDHLEGKTFLDEVSTVEKRIAIEKFRKVKRKVRRWVESQVAK